MDALDEEWIILTLFAFSGGQNVKSRKEINSCSLFFPKNLSFKLGLSFYWKKNRNLSLEYKDLIWSKSRDLKNYVFQNFFQKNYLLWLVYIKGVDRRWYGFEVVWIDLKRCNLSKDLVYYRSEQRNIIHIANPNIVGIRVPWR